MTQDLFNIDPRLQPVWNSNSLAGSNPQIDSGMGYGDYALQGAQSLAALYSAYNARKMGKLAKKQFGFEVDSANRNLSNQATAYNNDIAKRTRMGLALNGINDTNNPEYQRRMSLAQQGYVDGSPIR